MSLAGLVEGVARSASGRGLPVAASAAGSADREVVVVAGVRRCCRLWRGRRGCPGACGEARAAAEGGAPSIGSGVHELRVNDQDVTWRIVYRADEDAVVIVEVFAKKTQATPKATIATCSPPRHSRRGVRGPSARRRGDG